MHIAYSRKLVRFSPLSIPVRTFDFEKVLPVSIRFEQRTNRYCVFCSAEYLLNQITWRVV
jgi:hypothetical protein